MNLAGRLFRTTIGRKFLMAVTGVVLIGFVVVHLAGNLQIFEHPDQINGYSHFLHSLGPSLWFVRSVLLMCAAIHVWAATMLVIEDRRARGGGPARPAHWIQATLASRYMRWTGYLVLAFVFYHLAQFTWGTAQPGSYKTNLPPYTMESDYRIFGLTAVRAGTSVPDVHSMVILGFQKPVVALFYIIAVGLLSLHLLHGAESLFQTLGWRNGRWAGALRKTAGVCCLLYFLGNLIIPGSVLIGAKGLRPGYAGPGGRVAAATH